MACALAGSHISRQINRGHITKSVTFEFNE